MKIKLLTPRTGPAGAQNIGDEIDVPTAEAERMVEAGQAEIVRAAKPEKAVARRRSEKAAK